MSGLGLIAAIAEIIFLAAWKTAKLTAIAVFFLASWIIGLIIIASVGLTALIDQARENRAINKRGAGK